MRAAANGAKEGEAEDASGRPTDAESRPTDPPEGRREWSYGLC
jgi:hypothetical protein